MGKTVLTSGLLLIGTVLGNLALASEATLEKVGRPPSDVAAKSQRVFEPKISPDVSVFSPGQSIWRPKEEARQTGQPVQTPLSLATPKKVSIQKYQILQPLLRPGTKVTITIEVANAATQPTGPLALDLLLQNCLLLSSQPIALVAGGSSTLYFNFDIPFHAVGPNDPAPLYLLSFRLREEGIERYIQHDRLDLHLVFDRGSGNFTCLDNAVAAKHKVGTPVHQWIANEGYIFFESRIEGADISGYIGTISDSHGDNRDTFLEGTAAEDKDDRPPLYQECSVPAYWDCSYFRHFCAGADGQEIYQGYDSIPWFRDYDSALEQAENIWPYAIDEYPNNKALAFYYLGHVAHLVADMTVPAHTHNDPHAQITGDYDYYEENMVYNYQLWYYGSERSYWWWIYESTLFTDLYSLFYRVANYTEDYDSSDYDGDGPPYYDPDDYTDIWHDPGSVSRSGGIDIDEFTIIADDLMPYAMRRTADLIRLFYSQVDSSDPDCMMTHPSSDDMGNPDYHNSEGVITLEASASDSESGIVKVGYQFHYCYYSGSDWSDWADVSPSPAVCSALFSPPYDNTLYAFHVWAENGGGRFGDSGFKYVYVDATDPSAPAITGYSDSGHGVALVSGNTYSYSSPHFHFSSSDSGSGIAGYYYYWGTNPNGSPSIWSTSDSFTASGLVSGNDYYFRVEAEDIAGNTGGISTFTYRYYVCTPPPIPQNLQASDGTYADKIRVTWDNVAGEDGYRIYRAASSGGSYSQIATTMADDTDYDDNCGCSMTYWYKVKAYAGCDSGYSNYDQGNSQNCLPEPVITAIAPTSGPPGTYMEVYGQDFGGATGSVIFAGDVAGEILQWGDTVICCRVPDGVSDGDLFVRNGGGDSGGAFFDVTDPTTVYIDTNFTPNIENGTIEYPFGRIQSGIDAATTGDEVVVADGTYTGDGNRDIEFLGKAITVRSENGPDTCIIDCERYEGFLFWLEDQEYYIEGFSITNNAGYSAIICYNSSASITKCTFSENDCAIDAIQDENGWVDISNCEFSDSNYAISTALFENGRLDISNCTFSDNDFAILTLLDGNSWLDISNCTFSDNDAAIGTQIDDGWVDISNCTFSDNDYAIDFVNFYTLDGNGQVNISTCTFSENRFGVNNLGLGYVGLWPPANINGCTFTDNSVAMDNFMTDSRITNCTFSNNSAGGIIQFGGISTVANSLFTGNVAPDSGGAILLEGYGSDYKINNCTFVENSAPSGNAIACWFYYDVNYPTTLEVENCIFWDGEAEIWNGDGLMISIAYSNLQGGQSAVYDPCGAMTWGEGNIDVDPLFVNPGYWDPNGTPEDANDDFWVDGDYLLRPDSPCIDAGDPDYLSDSNATWLDVYGGLRFIGERVDMGADEYNPGELSDLNGDLVVDFKDYAIFSACQYGPDGQDCNGLSDIADIDHSGTCDFNDVEIFALEWLEEVTTDMVWVYIDDPGVSGHEGFTGEMSKYETTNAQYCEFLNAAKSDGLITVYSNDVYSVSDTGHNEIYFELYPGSSSYSQITYSGGVFSVRSRDGYDMSNHPVVMVNWYGATAFCNYYGYRLPTEWEWQAVADYNGSYTYGCGTTIDFSKANYFVLDSGYANPLNLSSSPYTSPVDHYSSYGYGMNDMAGNVWEWTSSCYYADCDPGYRVLRGGSWSGSDYQCSVSTRRYGNPYGTDYYLGGFRVCR